MTARNARNRRRRPFFGFWLRGAEGAPGAYKYDREPEKTADRGLEPRDRTS